MVATAPISELSNDVAFDTAYAVKKFFELCRASDQGYVALPPDTQGKVVAMDTAMQRVVASQSILLDALSKVTNEVVALPDFSKAVADLELTVAQTDAAISRAYSAPDAIVQILQKNLDAVAEQNSYIDNFVESFRIALNEACTALLSNLADRVIEG